MNAWTAAAIEFINENTATGSRYQIGTNRDASGSGSGNSDLVFKKFNGSNWINLIRIQDEGDFIFHGNRTANAQAPGNTIFRRGNVGIGTLTPSEKLTVEGKILTEEVTVKLAANWPDYVFADDYDLPTLDDVRAHIEQHGHLPEVPSAETVAAQGVQVGATQAVLLKKIEELTLYAIDQEEAVSAREKEARAQARRIKELEAQNARLQEQVGAQQETIDWLVEKVSSDE